MRVVSSRSGIVKSLAAISISILTLAALAFIAGCESSTEHVKQVSATTYVPSPPAQVVVEPPAPVVVTPPSTVRTTEERSSSDSTETGDSGTQESTSAYHSETSTVTPMTVVPAAP
jgi:hypothetical protein